MHLKLSRRGSGRLASGPVLSPHHEVVARHGPCAIRWIETFSCVSGSGGLRPGVVKAACSGLRFWGQEGKESADNSSPQGN
jgi:hypothetical protein